MVEREARKAIALAGEIAAVLHKSGLDVERLTGRMFAAKSAKPLRDAARLKLKFTREGWKHEATTGRYEQGRQFSFVRLTKPVIQGRGPKTHKDAELHLIPRRGHVAVSLGVLGWFKRKQPGPLVSANVTRLVAEELARRAEQQKPVRQQ